MTKDGLLVPRFSASDCRGLAAMMAKADELGWSYQANAGPDRATYVKLTNEQGGCEEGYDDTLPTAFARALLLAVTQTEGK